MRFSAEGSPLAARILSAQILRRLAVVYALAFDFLAARILAHRALCAAAIRFRPAAEMVRLRRTGAAFARLPRI